jgi:hypothetical protein
LGTSARRAHQLFFARDPEEQVHGAKEWQLLRLIWWLERCDRWDTVLFTRVFQLFFGLLVE